MDLQDFKSAKKIHGDAVGSRAIPSPRILQTQTADLDGHVPCGARAEDCSLHGPRNALRPTFDSTKFMKIVNSIFFCLDLVFTCVDPCFFNATHLPSLVSKYQFGKLSAGKALGPCGDLDFCVLQCVSP